MSDRNTARPPATPSCPMRSALRRCRPVHLLAIATFGALDGYSAGAVDEEFRAMGHEINDEDTWGNLEVATRDRAMNVRAAANDPLRPAGFGKVETMH